MLNGYRTGKSIWPRYGYTFFLMADRRPATRTTEYNRYVIIGLDSELQQISEIEFLIEHILLERHEVIECPEKVAKGDLAGGPSSARDFKQTQDGAEVLNSYNTKAVRIEHRVRGHDP
jgi:hypothetical protein